MWIWDFWWWIYSWRRSTHYPDRLHYFCVTIPKCYKDACVNSFFPDTVILWNSLPRECFPLTCDLIGFNSRINRHLFNCRFFLNRFPVCFNIFVFLFLVTPYLVVAVQPCIEWILIKKMLKVSFVNVILANLKWVRIKTLHSPAAGKKYKKRFIRVLFGKLYVKAAFGICYCIFATISLVIWSTLFLILNSGDVNWYFSM